MTVYSRVWTSILTDQENDMKKKLLTLFALVICMTMVACGSGNTSETDSGTSKDTSATTAPCAHEYQSEISKSATCSENGVTTYTCKKCSDTYTETIDKLAHTYTDANCTTPKTCTACGVTEGSALGHNAGEWIEEDDELVQYCKNCNEKLDSKPIPYSEGLEYRLDGSTYTVVGIGTCTDTKLRIPPTYDGKAVTKIAFSTPNYIQHITHVIIPDGVTSIEDFAFNQCWSLTSIVIPDSITSIGSCAFYGCSSLTSIVIPEGVSTIQGGTFKDCSSLTNVVIPKTVTFIENSAFYQCTSLTSVIIPDAVTSIGEFAFYGCSSLTGIAIPNGITTIEAYTFHECSSMATVTFSDSIRFIGKDAFRGCKSIESIVLPQSVNFIAEGAFDSCSILKDVSYLGTIYQWRMGFSHLTAFTHCATKVVHCTDGDWSLN